jgi:hypothetical protein
VHEVSTSSTHSRGCDTLRVAHSYMHSHLCAAGPLWQEYIAFLSGPKPGSPTYQALWSSGMVGGQEESTKTAALRCVCMSVCQISLCLDVA